MLPLPAEVAEHVRVDVQSDVGEIVNVFGGHQPHNLANLAFGKMAGQAREGVRVHLFLPGQLGHVIQRGAFGLGKKIAGAILIQRVELGFIKRRLDRKRPADINAKKTDIEPRHLLAYEQDQLARERQFFVQLADFPIKHAKGGRQSRTVYFDGGEYFAELSAGKIICQLHHQSLRLLDGS